MQQVGRIGVALALIGGSAAGVTAYVGDGPANPGSIGSACVAAVGIALGVWGAMRPRSDLSGVQTNAHKAAQAASETTRAVRAEGAAIRVAGREETEKLSARLDEIDGKLEIILQFIALSDEVAQQAKSEFGEEEVSIASQMTGQTVVSAFVKPTSVAMKAVLEFVNRRQDRLANAVLRVGKEEFSLQGYSADEAARLLESPGFQAALDKIRKA